MCIYGRTENPGPTLFPQIPHAFPSISKYPEAGLLTHGQTKASSLEGYSRLPHYMDCVLAFLIAAVMAPNCENLLASKWTPVTGFGFMVMYDLDISHFDPGSHPLSTNGLSSGAYFECTNASSGGFSSSSIFRSLQPAGICSTETRLGLCAGIGYGG